MMGSRDSYQTVDLPKGKDGREEMVIRSRGGQSGEGGEMTRLEFHVMDFV
jgi:hypothetical protein